MSISGVKIDTNTYHRPIPKMTSTVSLPYNINKYFDILDQSIYVIVNLPVNDTVEYDILDTEEDIADKKIAIRHEQLTKNLTEMWKDAIGYYDGFKKVLDGNSGIDVVSETRKIALIVKNRKMSASSRKSSLNKLSKYKKAHPDYTCIYATINYETDEERKGWMREITHDDAVVLHTIGMCFLHYIFKEETDRIVYFIRKTLSKYTKQV